MKEEVDVRLEFERFPKKYTCDGEDISPKVEISGKAESVAMIVDDPDAPIGTFTHWLIWNIESNVSVIPEGVPKKAEIADPIKAVQGKNDFGKIGYNGPCPPSGTHRYFFKVYLLDKKLDIPPASKKKKLEDAMKRHVVRYGEVVATYRRSR